MIEARDFIDACLKRELSLWSGVPCPFLTPLIHYAIQSRNLDYIAATSEREAAAVAAGAYLGGRTGVVVCQNSGLGNLVDPVTSLAYPFRIPMLLIVTHRGSEDLEDGPEHELMGKITGDLLLRMRVEWEEFPETRDAVDDALERAIDSMESNGLPYALVMKKPVLSEHPHQKRAEGERPPRVEPVGSFAHDPAERMSRLEAIETVREALSGSEALIATAGHTSGELFSLGHKSSQLYVIGGMGCASALALGVQRARRDRDVVVLDGDGSALMSMGTMATVGHYGPRRYTHVLLDNEMHASTGGQPTASPSIDFAGVASACGYRNVWWTDDPRELTEHIREAHRAPGPSFIHVKLAATAGPDPGAPRLTPHQVKAQFMDWIQGL
ncbi:MAG: phosphonopyruvate decarboxylase [Myxococcales bacterium]|nr:phosphonopyruvate decarboxylase [Myxococcales bacterium]